jgi:hypothetical protein
MAAYCRQHGLSYWMFVKWRRRLEQGTVRASPLTLIPVVAPPANGSVITIRLPDGVGIEVERGFDAAVLNAVMRALQVAPPC